MTRLLISVQQLVNVNLSQKAVFSAYLALSRLPHWQLLAFKEPLDLLVFRALQILLTVIFVKEVIMTCLRLILKRNGRLFHFEYLNRLPGDYL